MNRIQKVILGLLVGFLSLFVIVVYRYNLTFGETVFQKSMMAGCMSKILKTEDFSDSEDKCECLIGSLVEKYSEEEIRNNIDQIKLKDKILFDKCRSENVN